ncbi:hypothetical protein G6F50_015135 [Rhizopus delemar]|uniref:Uncharacterized protein n=1 Tax=Rhizopus delemar TaxID=936053 RepID=A0A9P6Y097_9FUNG|nr:hypothetical protein G6F50_015135 [Rhizopus delemar]
MPSSTNPQAGLTVWDASSSHLTLWIMVIAVVIFLPIVTLYTAWVYRVMRGKVTHDSHPRARPVGQLAETAARTVAVVDGACQGGKGAADGGGRRAAGQRRLAGRAGLAAGQRAGCGHRPPGAAPGIAGKHPGHRRVDAAARVHHLGG